MPRLNLQKRFSGAVVDGAFAQVGVSNVLLCFTCGHKISAKKCVEVRKSKEAKARLLHVECVNCFACKKLITTRYAIRGEEIYCEACTKAGASGDGGAPLSPRAPNLEHPQSVCTGCTIPIGDQEDFVLLDDAAYHFTCAPCACGKLLKDVLQTTKCDECTAKAETVKCAVCERAIGDVAHVAVAGAHYCDDHLRCAKCKRALDATSTARLVDDAIVCDSCFDEE